MVLHKINANYVYSFFSQADTPNTSFFSFFKSLIQRNCELIQFDWTTMHVTVICPDNEDKFLRDQPNHEKKHFSHKLGKDGTERPLTTDESGTHLVINCLLTTTLEKHLC